MVLNSNQKRRCACGRDFEELGYARHVKKCGSTKSAARRAVENHQSAVRQRKEREAEAVAEQKRLQMIAEARNKEQEVFPCCDNSSEKT